MTRNDQLLLHLAQGLSVGDAAKEDDHDAGAVGGFNHCNAILSGGIMPSVAVVCFRLCITVTDSEEACRSRHNHHDGDLPGEVSSCFRVVIPPA